MHTEIENSETDTTPPQVETETEKPKLAVVTKNLKIKLTEPEIVERATQMAKAVAEWNRVDAERAATAKEFKEQLAEIDGRVQMFKTVVLEAAEFRDVEVTVERDLFGKRVITRLASTGEVVEERPMQEHDRQLELQIAAQQADGGGEVIPLEIPADTTAQKRAREERSDLTEEQRFAETPEEAEAMREARMAADDSERADFTDEHETVELPAVTDEGLAF